MVIYYTKGLTARAQARELLTLAAKEHWGLSSLPEIARREHGKPYFPGHEGLHFNLSHSGGLALCALDGAPVGVDIQLVKEWRPSLPERVCSGPELDWLESQPDMWSAFTLLWTLKEARAKESGRGLTTSIRDIRVLSRRRVPSCWTACGFVHGPDRAGRRRCADTVSRRKIF